MEEDEFSFAPWYTRYLTAPRVIAASVLGVLVFSIMLYANIQEQERKLQVYKAAQASAEDDARREEALEPPPKPANLLQSRLDARPVQPNHAPAFIVSKDWNPMPEPKPGDWVSQHPEPAQSFASYVMANPNIVGEERNVLYLRPTADFKGAPGLDIEVLREFLSIYFQLEARIGEPLDTSELRSRIHTSTKKRQLHADTVLDAMIEDVPEDAYAVLALTSVDLYPEESWNFVFGMARFKDRVGVYSVARFYEDFFSPGTKTPPLLVLKRTLAIIAHETGHMFSMAHCKHFHCVMNGTNSLSESDRGTLHLCPVGLRKLYHAHPFDPTERYRQLQTFYAARGLTEEAAWTQRRADVLSSPRE